MSELLPSLQAFSLPFLDLSKTDTLIFFFTSPSDMVQPITLPTLHAIQGNHSFIGVILVPLLPLSFRKLQQKFKEINQSWRQHHHLVSRALVLQDISVFSLFSFCVFFISMLFIIFLIVLLFLIFNLVHVVVWKNLFDAFVFNYFEHSGFNVFRFPLSKLCCFYFNWVVLAVLIGAFTFYFSHFNFWIHSCIVNVMFIQNCHHFYVVLLLLILVAWF